MAGASDAWFNYRPQRQGVISDGAHHVVASLALPAGSYLLTGRTTLEDGDRDAFAYCDLWSAGSLLTSTPVGVDDKDVIFVNGLISMTSVPLTAAVTLPGPVVVDLACSTHTDGLDAFSSSLAAIKVTNLHVQ